MVIPFKGQESANYVKKELRDLSIKVQTTVQPVFVSRKIDQDLKVRENKPQIVNQQRVVYRFQCDLCEARYVGYTRGHLHTRVDGHKQKASSVYKHCHQQHSEVPKELLRRFSILKKCKNKFDCLVNEMLFIGDLKPILLLVSVIMCFYRSGLSARSPTPNLEDQGLFFVWPLPFDQPGMVRPARDQSPRWHSSLGH